MTRQEILKKLEDYRFVPGHGPCLEEKTDEELLELLEFLEKLFDKEDD